MRRAAAAAERERLMALRDASKGVLEAAIVGVQQEIDSRETDAGKSASIDAELRALYQQRADYESRFHDTSGGLSLADAAALSAADDAIEGMDAELDYATSELDDARLSFNEAKEAESELLRRYDGMDDASDGSRPPRAPGPINTTPPVSAARLIKACAQRGAESRRAVERSAKATEELHARLGDARRQLGEMEARVAAQEFDYERRVTELQRGHEARVKELLRQAHIAAVGTSVEASAATAEDTSVDLPDTGAEATSSKGGGIMSLRDSIGELGKLRDARIQSVAMDNMYYKQANRELKRKLRSMLDATDKERAAFDAEREALRVRSRELEAMNSSLITEVHTYKNGLRQSGQLVRVSMSNLRPMTADEVSQRARTAGPKH